MGMWDYVYLVGSPAAQVRCAAGHPRWLALESKSMEVRNLEHYYVVEDRLYHWPNRGGIVPFPERGESGASFLERHAERLEPMNWSGELDVYGSCIDCEPIVFAKSQTMGIPTYVHYPMLEYVLLFENGGLHSSRCESVDTSERLRSAFLQDGMELLQNDDPIAQERIVWARGEEIREGTWGANAPHRLY